jgi:hypothetical protein
MSKLLPAADRKAIFPWRVWQGHKLISEQPTRLDAELIAVAVANKTGRKTIVRASK